MSLLKSKGKQYGLIMPAKKAASKPLARPSVFGDSSSDEEDDGKKHVNRSLKREHEKRAKQTHEAAVRALEEDPSIFEYDSLYDKMTEEKKKVNLKLQRETKPKYIHALKKAAERRKLESELVYEHMAQKELEKEEGQFGDKESFVTSAYKKKLEERKKLEEELAREAAFEEANDVRKQKDLSRFHKHLFHQVVTPGSEGKGEKGSHEHTAPSHSAVREQSSKDETGRRREVEGRSREEDKRERRWSSDRERRGWEGERRRSGEGRHSREDYSHHERRRSSDHERRSSHRRDDSRRDSDRRDSERRDSHRREEKEESPNRVDVERTPSPLPTKETEREKEEEVFPAPPQKKTKLEAGIEIEVEDVDPAERRKQAAIKRATQESTMSAKERYLARKRARHVGEGDKHDQ